LKLNALLLAMAVSCVIAAIANVIIAHYTTVNLFTLRIWFVIPVGAVLIGAAAASGAMLAAWLLNIRPSMTTAAISAAMAGIGSMFLIYYFGYVTLQLPDGRMATDLVSFGEYLDLSITKSHTRMGRRQQDLGEVGGLGYAIALIEIFGFVVGAFGLFCLILALPFCSTCRVYLKKIKAISVKELTLDEAGKMHEVFLTGEPSLMKELLAWKPPTRKLKHDEPRARLNFKLSLCPKCSTQTLYNDVQVANDDHNNWREVKSLKATRMFAPGTV
jgi:hypothetical protein